MSLAALEDINKYLPQDKLPMLEADDDELQLTAERVIKGFLSGTFTPVELVSWTDPTTTPDLIQEIAGKYIAALYYRVRLSEDFPEFSGYAQALYNEALDMIQGVRTGTFVLVDPVTTEPVAPTGRLAEGDFFPDESLAPVFTMDARF